MPSGQIDVYMDLDAGSYYTITEGICISQEANVSATNNGYICKDQSISLSAPEGLSYMWSTGAETAEIETTRWGYYSVAAADGECQMPVNSFVAKPQNDSDYSNLIQQLDTPLCEGMQVRLAAPDAKSYLWSNGDQNQNTTVDKSGTYTITVEDFCDNEFEEELTLSFQEASPTVLGDTVIIAPGETPRDAILKAEGKKLKWYQTPEEDKAVFEGDSLIIPELGETTTYYVTGETTQTFSTESTGEANWIGSNKYSARTANGGMFFHVREASTIQTIDVSTDSIGTRTIQIFNSDQDLLFERTYDLIAGDTTLTLDVSLDEGIDYFMTTSSDQNLETFGFKGPQLIRNNQRTRYPYKDSDLLWITNSSFGEDYYLYFYNWKVKRHDLVCVSERVPVTAVLEVKSSTIEKYSGHFEIYPNPTNRVLTIESTEGHVLDQITVYDILGRAVVSKPASRTELQEIDLTSLSNGQYCIKLTTTDNLSYAYRIIKQE